MSGLTEISVLGKSYPYGFIYSGHKCRIACMRRTVIRYCALRSLVENHFPDYRQPILILAARPYQNFDSPSFTADHSGRSKSDSVLR